MIDAYSQRPANVVMHKRSGELKEMTKSWMGYVIWMAEYDDIPKHAICIWPYVIYDDEKRFNDYVILGDL